MSALGILGDIAAEDSQKNAPTITQGRGGGLVVGH